MTRPAGDEPLLTPNQVARHLGMPPAAVAAWADAGSLTDVRTEKGLRRYRRSEVYALGAAQRPPAVIEEPDFLSRPSHPSFPEVITWAL